MNRTVRPLLALCMIVSFFHLAAAAPSYGQVRRSENVARYKKGQIEKGAQRFDLLAQFAYRQAFAELKKGDHRKAEEHLNRALGLNPNYADAYFTLARLHALRFSPDVFYFVTQGFISIAREFRLQGLIAVNGIINAVVVLITLVFIACVAFAIKYLPFASHRIQEFLATRFRAALPGFSAYLLLLIPFVLFPGIITTFALVVVICWAFMSRRERFSVVMLILPLTLLSLFSYHVKKLTPLTDPKSLTLLASRASTSPGDHGLIRAIERTRAKNLDLEKDLALGLLHLRNEQFVPATDYLFRAISLDPKDVMGYVNLGNVYYLQGQYEKALEGYRKAESIDSTDAVCQYNLAQAYIKTLLMTESSRALRQASALGIEKVKASYAEETLGDLQVFPKTFSNSQLWRLATVEGEHYPDNFLNDVIFPVTRFPLNYVSWILLGALFIAVSLAKIVRPTKLTFQCSNCGRLTCENCCNNERATFLCPDCAKYISGVSSEKVTEALLRQKRQAVLVKRRKSARIFTVLLPGIRDLYYGRLARGFFLAGLFSLAVVQVFAKGFIVRDASSLDVELPLWKSVLPVAGIVFTYLSSMISKQSYDYRSYRNPFSRLRLRDSRPKPERPKRVASL